MSCLSISYKEIAEERLLGYFAIQAISPRFISHGLVAYDFLGDVNSWLKL